MKKALKVIGFIFLIVIVFLFGSYYLTIHGNPFTKHKIFDIANNYIVENYSLYDYEVKEVNYNFKNDTYVAQIYSDTSIDSHFAVSFNKNGELVSDEYHYVTDKFNTFTRINDEYRLMVDEAFKDVENMDENGNFVYGYMNIGKEDDYYLNYFPEVDYFPMESLELDEIYDINNLANRYGIIVYHIKDEATAENIAKHLKLINDVLEAKNVNYNYLNVAISDDGDMLNIEYFPKELITTYDLIGEVEASIERTDVYYSSIEK